MSVHAIQIHKYLHNCIPTHVCIVHISFQYVFTEPHPSGKPLQKYPGPFLAVKAIGTLLIPNALLMMTGLNDQNFVSIGVGTSLRIFGNVIC